MKLSAAVVLLFTSAVLAAPREAEECIPEENCRASAGCFCSVTDPPIENPPQFVVLTFDDAVAEYIHQTYYMPLLFDRRNPDGNLIGATFYVPHEYTDYFCVNELYRRGFEIASHSISKNSMSSYWQNASVNTLVDEFDGQRRIISTFANISISDIVGARTPNLALAGDRTFEAYKQSDIQFDNSWPAFSYNQLFPYTLDFLSSQPCIVGECPTASFPGKWVLPIIALVGKDNKQCNSLLGCEITGTAAEIQSWLTTQFRRTYEGNRAPQSLLINSAWFLSVENATVAFRGFLDSLQQHSDVFLVSHSDVIDWMKNPVPASQYKTATRERSATCNARVCPLMKGEQEIRYMRSCVSCPEVYPWLGNPLGLPES